MKLLKLVCSNLREGLARIHLIWVIKKVPINTTHANNFGRSTCGKEARGNLLGCKLQQCTRCSILAHRKLEAGRAGKQVN